MKIKSIEITNVKGISNDTFNLDLIPNKPNLLVAPNGFGKTSFGIAFNSLKPSKLELDEKNLHEGNDGNKPELKLIVEEAGVQKTLIANDTTNSISNDFDIFVINSQLAAKATLLRIGGTNIAKPSLEIATTVLIHSIPPKASFDYSFTTSKRSFGCNGKILPDISAVFQNGYLLHHAENTIALNKFSQVKITRSIDEVKAEINNRPGTTEQIKQWIRDDKLASLRAIDELNNLASLINTCQFPTIADEADSFLAAMQFVEIFKSKGGEFKKACKYQYYLDEKAEYRDIISSFNSTRLKIQPKEDKKKGLIVECPKAHQISNGQRDVLSFIVLILKARRNFKKRDCILVIDEIFDYLDDANLISFQYFITTFIEEMKDHGRNLFPLLMTHLDPMYFNHFCFNRHKIKVHYLKNAATSSNPHLLKLIRNREDASIQNYVDLHYFHYHPNDIDLTAQFNALALNPGWAESRKFHTHIRNEVKKYLEDKTDYDPLAICFGVRVRIEYLIYQKIDDAVKKQLFIDEHGTKKKLEYCEQLALDVPEVYYLLGIIYNDRLHWKDNIDIVRPVALKLENLTIKKLIRDIFK